MATVVSLRGRLGDPDLDPALNPDVVYVGRRQWWGPGRLLDGHRLANPYSIRRYGRTEALRLYRARLATLPDLAGLLEPLRGKVLACWCTPDPCHADILAELLGTDPDTLTTMEGLF